MAIHEDPGLVADSPAGKDLLAITEWVAANGAQGLIGVTGSFLVGCHNEHSDIDLVCYGPEGYEAAHALFHHKTFACISSKEIGEISLLAEITDHAQGLATPAVYEIKVKTVLSSTVDEPASFAHRITHMRSYLGAYTGAFRSGDTVHLSGKLVHTQDGKRSGFGIELTPWTVSNSYVASLAG
ncbi:nucleotidyltransferase domain-containing protein [Streptomyces sp. NPDC001739]